MSKTNKNRSIYFLYIHWHNLPMRGVAVSHVNIWDFPAGKKEKFKYIRLFDPILYKHLQNINK